MVLAFAATAATVSAVTNEEGNTLTHEKDWRFAVVLRVHVFDKLRSIDLSLAEFEQLLERGEIIDETLLETGEVKELVLLIDWRRPLHVVVIVDERHTEERIVTVYEPHPDLWSPDYRRRRR